MPRPFLYVQQQQCIFPTFRCKYQVHIIVLTRSVAVKSTKRSSCLLPQHLQSVVTTHEQCQPPHVQRLMRSAGHRQPPAHLKGAQLVVPALPLRRLAVKLKPQIRQHVDPAAATLSPNNTHDWLPDDTYMILQHRQTAGTARVPSTVLQCTCLPEAGPLQQRTAAPRPTDPARRHRQPCSQRGCPHARAGSPAAASPAPPSPRRRPTHARAASPPSDVAGHGAVSRCVHTAEPAFDLIHPVPTP